MKRQAFSLIASLLLTGGALAQPMLPDPEQCLSSPGMERLAGSLFAQRYEKGFGSKPDILAPDHPDTLMVQTIVNRLGKVVAFDRPHMRLQAKVVTDPEVNAFCIPAGYIYVNTGLIKLVREKHPKDADSALAAVLGHEIAHAVLRHSLQQWRTSKDFRNVLQDGDTFQKTLLAMSRGQELEADRYGLLYSIRAGYKVEPGIAFFGDLPEMKRRIDDTGGTHPVGSARVAQLKKYVGQLKQLLSLWEESRKAAASDRLSDAQTVLEILAAEFPNLPSVHNNLGWVSYEQFERGAAVRPPFRVAPAYTANLGLTLRGTNDEPVPPMLQKAEDEFREALQCDPDMQEARAGCGACCMIRHDLAAAESVLNPPVAVEKPGAALLTMQGVLAAQQGKTALASERYTSALAQDPKYLPALYNLGVLDPVAHKAELDQMVTLEGSGYWVDQARKGGATVAAAPAVVTLQGLGGLKLGMNSRDIAGKMGQPAGVERLASASDRQSYPKQGLELWLGPGGLTMIRSTPARPDPATGLQVGMAQSAVAEKLGQPQRVTQDETGTTYWHYPGRGLSVAFSGASLSALMVSRP